MELEVKDFIVINQEHCPRNHRCSMIFLCPNDAITQKDSTSFPEINYVLCNDCGECYAMCRAFERKPD